MKQIELQNIGKQFEGRWVFSGLFETINKGEAVMVTGASGSGKTTLAKIIMGLEPPEQGQVLLEGEPVFSCVFQEDRLSPFFSAVDNIGFVLQGKQQDISRKALLELGIETSQQDKPVALLSGGQRRRVALARALLASSDVVVLDEAFKGLDALTYENALRFVQQNLQGRTLLLITHQPKEGAFFNARGLSLDSLQKQTG